MSPFWDLGNALLEEIRYMGLVCGPWLGPFPPSASAIALGLWGHLLPGGCRRPREMSECRTGVGISQDSWVFLQVGDTGGTSVERRAKRGREREREAKRLTGRLGISNNDRR